MKNYFSMVTKKDGNLHRNPVSLLKQRLMRINTQLLMTASSFFLAVIGLTLTFLATEITGFLQISSGVFQLFVQILGALYLGFAFLNWMAKGSIMGGIYNRPIAISNLAHFLIGSLTLIKDLIHHPDRAWAVWIIAGLYTIFALLFGKVVFTSPATDVKKT